MAANVLILPPDMGLGGRHARSACPPCPLSLPRRWASRQITSIHGRGRSHFATTAPGLGGRGAHCPLCLPCPACPLRRARRSCPPCMPTVPTVPATPLQARRANNLHTWRRTLCLWYQLWGWAGPPCPACPLRPPRLTYLPCIPTVPIVPATPLGAEGLVKGAWAWKERG